MKSTLKRIKEAIAANEKAVAAAAATAEALASPNSTIAAEPIANAVTFHECKLLQMFVAQYQPDVVSLLESDEKYFTLFLELLNTPYSASFGPKFGNPGSY